MDKSKLLTICSTAAKNVSDELNKDCESRIPSDASPASLAAYSINESKLFTIAFVNEVLTLIDSSDC